MKTVVVIYSFLFIASPTNKPRVGVVVVGEVGAGGRVGGGEAATGWPSLRLSTGKFQQRVKLTAL